MAIVVLTVDLLSLKTLASSFVELIALIQERIVSRWIGDCFQPMKERTKIMVTETKHCNNLTPQISNITTLQIKLFPDSGKNEYTKNYTS